MDQTRSWRMWREWRGFVIFVVVMLVFRSAVADWNQVPSGSMLPSILVGDRIVVDKRAYDLRVPFTLLRIASWGSPQRGDVVTFTSPEDDRLLVKRIVAVPGDEISMRNNRLIINGATATYSPLPAQQAPIAMTASYGLYEEDILGSRRNVMLRDDAMGSFVSSFRTTRVPPGHYLMLGDNRDNSRDSRAIGFVPRERIVGQAKAIAFSLNYDNYYAPRMDRFLADLP